MGLKSGSRDADLDDSESDADREDDRGSQETEESRDGVDAATDSTAAETDDENGESATGSGTGTERPTMDSLPYKLRRDKVNEGREQVPYFLREEVIAAEADLQNALEERLGEDVYKSDYREAAMVVAQRNPELVAEVLREWGYDLE